MSVQTRSHEFNRTAASKPFAALADNPNRVYIAIVTLAATGKLLFCIGPPGSVLPAFADGSATNNLQFLRRDWGPLVTNSIWVTDGAGHDPFAHWIITEGVLVPDAAQPKPTVPFVYRPTMGTVIHMGETLRQLSAEIAADANAAQLGGQ